MKEIKKAIIYGRVSPTDDPNEDKIETQLFKVRNYCQRMGWEVVKEFVEPGHVSGTIPILERPVAQKMIEFLESGKADVVVTSDDQRFTRSDDLIEWTVIINALKKHGTYTANPQAGIEDVTNFAGSLMKILKMAFSAKEREDILARQQGGKDKAREDNRYASGGVPFGVRWVHKGKDHPNRGYWKPLEDQVKVLKDFFRLVRKGFALETIADRFNEEGIPTKYGKTWAGSTLNQILKKDFYFTGILDYKDGSKVDTKIKLFSRMEVEKVRKARALHPSLKKKKVRPNEAQHPPGSRLLQGLMNCECGRIMSPVDQKPYYYYRCRRKGCRSGGLKMLETDKAVWQVFEHQLSSPEATYEALKAESLLPSGDIREARRRLKVAEGKLRLNEESQDRFAILWARKKISEKAYTKEIAKLEKEELAYKKEKERAENTTLDSESIQLAVEESSKWWDKKIQLIKSLRLLEEIKISLEDADKEIQTKYYPELLEILKDLKGKIPEIDKSISRDEIKNLTFEIKRNTIRESKLLFSTKITYYKNGRLEVEGLLPSEFLSQPRISCLYFRIAVGF